MKRETRRNGIEERQRGVESPRGRELEAKEQSPSAADLKKRECKWRECHVTQSQ
jgi:hypothetical protein